MKITNRKLVLGWELRLELLVRKLRQQAEMQKPNMNIYSDEAEKARQLGRKIQLEETNQKVLLKEERPKRYRDRTKQYKPNRTF